MSSKDNLGRHLLLLLPPAGVYHCVRFVGLLNASHVSILLVDLYLGFGVQEDTCGEERKHFRHGRCSLLPLV